MRILPYFLTLVVAAIGCQTSGSSRFAPFSAKLESIRGSPAQYFFVVNTSGQELHNYKYTAYLYSELLRRDPLVRNLPIRKDIASGSRLRPGQVMRFRSFDKAIQDPLVQPITRVLIVGHCDEGRFRQQWMTTISGELRPVGGASD
jgi:hypothetical protein